MEQLPEYIKNASDSIEEVLEAENVSKSTIMLFRAMIKTAFHAGKDAQLQKETQKETERTSEE